jgi:hypothetical protein
VNLTFLPRALAPLRHKFSFNNGMHSIPIFEKNEAVFALK